MVVVLVVLVVSDECTLRTYAVAAAVAAAVLLLLLVEDRNCGVAAAVLLLLLVEDRNCGCCSCCCLVKDRNSGLHLVKYRNTQAHLHFTTVIGSLFTFFNAFCCAGLGWSTPKRFFGFSGGEQ